MVSYKKMESDRLEECRKKYENDKIKKELDKKIKNIKKITLIVKMLDRIRGV